MLKKKISILFIFLISSIPLYSWLGSGTVADPYQIWTKADLEAIADTVAFYSTTLGWGTNNWTRNKSFILMADITDTLRRAIVYYPLSPETETDHHNFFFL